VNFIVPFLLSILDAHSHLEQSKTMRKNIVLVTALLGLFIKGAVAQETDRYVLIEAPCKATFNANTNHDENVVLTPVFKVEFENAFEVLNAEPELIREFEVALEKAYPNSRNHIKDILLYMLTSEREAKALHARKRKQYEALNVGLLPLKIRK
jgi:hypothetical protein